MAYKHAYINTVLLLHCIFMLSWRRCCLKGRLEAMHFKNSHGNYIVDHGKSWENHGFVFLNFCGNLAYFVF